MALVWEQKLQKEYFFIFYYKKNYLKTIAHKSKIKNWWAKIIKKVLKIKCPYRFLKAVTYLLESRKPHACVRLCACQGKT